MFRVHPSSTGFLIHLCSTLCMTGAIWFIQLVHYPLFDHVPAQAFAAYEAAHTRLTLLLVVPLMLMELATAVWLVWRRPPGIAVESAWIGLVLLAVIWLSTALLQGFSEAAYRSLVASNWIRTIGWTARSWVVLRMTSELLTATPP